MILVVLGTLLTFTILYDTPAAVLRDYSDYQPVSTETQELSADWNDLTAGTTVVHIEKIEPASDTSTPAVSETTETNSTATTQETTSSTEETIEQTDLDILLEDIELAIKDINHYDRYLEKYQDAVTTAENDDDLDAIDDDMDDLRDSINDLDDDLDDIDDRFDDMDYRDYDGYSSEDFDKIQHRIDSTFENFSELKQYFNEVNEELNDKYDVV